MGRPDPCDPSPCGPGTMCMENQLGNPICRCLAGLIPKPDTITGCGPECTIDPDCSTGYICDNQNVLKNLTHVTLLLVEPELLVPLKVPPGQKLVPARVLLDLLVIPDKNVLRVNANVM